MPSGYKLTAALKRYRIVTVAAGQLGYCGAGGMAVGSLQEGAPDNTFPVGSIVSPESIECGKEAEIEAGEVLIPDDLFACGANGVAAKEAAKTLNTLGKVIRGAAAPGAIARVVYGK
jgi:hypothetical protein